MVTHLIKEHFMIILLGCIVFINLLDCIDDVSIDIKWHYNFVDQLCYDDRYPEIYKTGLRQAIDGLQNVQAKKE